VKTFAPGEAGRLGALRGATGCLLLMLLPALAVAADPGLTLKVGPERCFGDRTVTRTFQVEGEGACTLEWRTRILRGVIERGKADVVAPAEVAIELRIPAVRAKVEMIQEMQLKQEDKVLADASFAIVLYPDTILAEAFGRPDGKMLGVIDDSGDLVAVLEKEGAHFAQIKANLQFREATSGVVLCAANQHVTVAEPYSGLREFVLGGGSAIFLEQREPLSLSWFEDAPPWRLDEQSAATALPLVKMTHPLLRGLAAGDFANWAGRGDMAGPVLTWPEWPSCRALMVSGGAPAMPVLIEAWGEGGRTILCQLDMGQRLLEEPVAQTLLGNLVEYCRTTSLPPHLRETRLAIPPEAIRKGEFDTTHSIVNAKPDDLKKALGVIILLTPTDAPVPAAGCDLARLISDGAPVLVQSCFGEEIVGALNHLIGELWPPDSRRTPPPKLLAIALEEKPRIECDYAQPLAWGIPAEKVARALDGAEEVNTVRPDRELPSFRCAIQPGILMALECGKGRIVFCALPVEDAENKERAWLVGQSVNNMSLSVQDIGGYPVRGEQPPRTADGGL